MDQKNNLQRSAKVIGNATVSQSLRVYIGL